MLVLSRVKGQSISIGNDIKIKYLRDDQQKGIIYLGIDAPTSIKILREEIVGIKYDMEINDE